MSAMAASASAVKFSVSCDCAAGNKSVVDSSRRQRVAICNLSRCFVAAIYSTERVKLLGAFYLQFR